MYFLMNSLQTVHGALTRLRKFCVIFDFCKV